MGVEVVVRKEDANNTLEYLEESTGDIGLYSMGGIKRKLSNEEFKEVIEQVPEDILEVSK